MGDFRVSAFRMQFFYAMNTMNMNMNSTAQARFRGPTTTTQVECGKHVEQCRHGNDIHKCSACAEIGMLKAQIEVMRGELTKMALRIYPVPPHTMTNRGHLRDMGCILIASVLFLSGCGDFIKGINNEGNSVHASVTPQPTTK